MKKRRSNASMTAEEVMEMLNNDEEYLRRTAEHEQRMKKIHDARAEEEKDLVAELNAAGLNVKCVWDFVNTADSYPAAVPILLKHLQKPYSDRIKDGIARALITPDAIDGWDIILAEFEKHPDKRAQGAKFGMSLALSRIIRATKRYDEALRLAREERHGENRSEFIEALGYSKDPEIIAKLEEFVDDPIVGNEARWYLKNPGRRFRGTGGTVK